jgi:hypothetical protein
MSKCSTCGYLIDEGRAYCRICLAIGCDKVNQNPEAFGESARFLPALAYCTTLIIEAISTRAEPGEVTGDIPPAMTAIYLVGAEPLEAQDENGKEIAAPPMSKVEGTDFVKMGPFYVKE